MIAWRSRSEDEANDAAEDDDAEEKKGEKEDLLLAEATSLDTSDMSMSSSCSAWLACKVR